MQIPKDTQNVVRCSRFSGLLPLSDGEKLLADGHPGSKVEAGFRQEGSGIVVVLDDIIL